MRSEAVGRGGCAALAAGRPADLRLQLAAFDRLLAGRGPDRRRLRFAVRTGSTGPVTARASTFTSRTASGSASCGQTGSTWSGWSSCKHPRMLATTSTTTSCRRSGRNGGRRRICGSRVSQRERAARASASARVDVASAAGDPRAAGSALRRRRAAVRRGRRAGVDPVELVRGRTRRARRGRWRRRPASGRCSASTRRSCWTVVCTESPPRPRRRRDARGARRPNA